MDEKTYVELLNIVTPLIKRQDTIMRTAISPHERLNATLSFPQQKQHGEVLLESLKPHILNCIGAVDGKNVNIIPPQNSGAYYYNYKGYNSLVLMAICDANCGFIMCDFGVNGRISDGGIIAYTQFYKKLKRELPFVFIGFRITYRFFKTF
ncbi:unnamed protein product [Acanthoscelides obtectus]|uniref:DDE Tnp4 domain-containing protein n=1 Tax=Acanthoscelides obtectus TaxID=200917 RepID=A0A9P0L6D5_ACAOB|nr:unnamed protein product [Acanthoscelides obtectus]CAK1624666.1 hypothetical protein AOBTE_LOCUS2685 [Acanthoscelides obtectus]